MQDQSKEKSESDLPVFSIKSRVTSKILFELQCKSLSVCIEKAVSMKVDLMGADLRGAYLRGAYLQGADLRDADLSGADLQGAYLRDADLQGAYLRDADLRDADLRGAYLRDADLRGVYLQGAYLRDDDLQGGIKIQKTPIQILGMIWDIFIFDSHIKIGCEFHSIKEWEGFNDERISKMESRALEWWKQNKESILAVCKSNGRG